MGIRREQAGLRGAFKAERVLSIAREMDVIGAILLDSARHLAWAIRKRLSVGNLGGIGIVMINVAAIAHRTIQQVIGDDPIHKEIVGRDRLAGGFVGRIDRLQDVVDAFHPVLRVFDQGLGGLIAKAVEEIGHKQEAAAIMGTVRPGVGTPIGQLNVRVGGVFVIRAADVVSV